MTNSHDEKRSDDSYKGVEPEVVVTDAYPTDVERHLEEKDHHLAITNEGDHGTKRALPGRITSMIAIAGTIGTGLFLGSGSAIAQGGAVGTFLGYTVLSTFIGFMMYSLGEMVCFKPNIGGFIEMGNNYVCPSFGFLMGFSFCLNVGLSVPSELSAVAVLIGYWDSNTKHAAAYITAFLFLTWGCNLLGVRWYGEAEFVCGIIKCLMLVGLMIFGLIADLGGVPGHREFIGGKIWREAPFNPTFRGVSPVALAQFLGFFSTFVKAAFAFSGIEAIGLLGGEAHNPRKTLRTAIRTVFYRITVIYILGILILSLNIRYDDPMLLAANDLGGDTAASSPFVVIAKRCGVDALAHVINAVVVTSAWSAGNESLYGMARGLMGMSRNGYGFKCFLWTTKQGVPWVGVSIGSAFGLLAYMSCSSGSNQAFTWLSDLTGLMNLINWACISFCFIRFKGACDVQGLDRRNFPLRGWCQPYMAWSSMICFLIITLFSGFKAFVPVWDYQSFIANYISIPVILLAWLAWWIYRRDSLIPLDQIDLSGGPASALIGTKYAEQAIA